MLKLNSKTLRKCLTTYQINEQVCLYNIIYILGIQHTQTCIGRDVVYV